MISVHQKVKAVADLLTICKMLINMLRYHTGMQSGTCVTCALTVTLARHAHSHAHTLALRSFPRIFKEKRKRETARSESRQNTAPPPYQLSADPLLTQLLTPYKIKTAKGLQWHLFRFIKI